MIKIIVTNRLKRDIIKIFGKTISLRILDLFETLKENPQKGKKVGKVGSVLIKELKYETFRFYFLVDGIKLKFLTENEITDLIIKFVRMSKKDDQNDVIQEIKDLLKRIKDI